MSPNHGDIESISCPFGKNSFGTVTGIPWKSSFTCFCWGNTHTHTPLFSSTNGNLRDIYDHVCLVINWTSRNPPNYRKIIRKCWGVPHLGGCFRRYSNWNENTDVPFEPWCPGLKFPSLSGNLRIFFWKLTCYNWIVHAVLVGNVPHIHDIHDMSSHFCW